MLPFLLLATRAETTAADEEYAAFVRFSGLAPEQLVRVRLESAPMPPVDLADYSGIVLGGSPFDSSKPHGAKSAVQRRVEAELSRLLDRVVAADFPFLGACYGVGALGTHQGALVDATYAETVGPVRIQLTAEGVEDPLLGVLPHDFEAFVGHKEAITRLPGHAVHLAASDRCPVQAFKVGRNVYATQFHPELDIPGIHARMEIYRNAGYFDPGELEELKRAASLSSVVHPTRLLPRFVELYAR